MYINVYMYICKHVYIYSKGGVATVVHRHKVCRRWEGNESIVLRNLKKGLTPAQPETTTQSDCDDECRGVNLIYIHIYIYTYTNMNIQSPAAAAAGELHIDLYKRFC